MRDCMGLSCNSSSVGMNFLHSFMSGLSQPACPISTNFENYERNSISNSLTFRKSTACSLKAQILMQVPIKRNQIQTLETFYCNVIISATVKLVQSLLLTPLDKERLQEDLSTTIHTVRFSDFSIFTVANFDDPVLIRFLFSSFPLRKKKNIFVLAVDFAEIYNINKFLNQSASILIKPAAFLTRIPIMILTNSEADSLFRIPTSFFL